MNYKQVMGGSVVFPPRAGFPAGVGRCPYGYRRRHRARRGIATFWLILFVPVFLVLLGVVVNVANLWLARVELENALESAALAAVKEWVETPGGGTSGATSVGMAYAAANTVRGQPVHLTTGAFLFGSIYQDLGGDMVFDATQTPDCTASPQRHPGVWVQAVVGVAPLWGNLLGHALTPGQVTANAVAVYPCGTNHPRLIWVDKRVGP